MKIMSNIKPNFHRVCNSQKVYTQFDQNRSNNNQDRHAILIYQFYHNITASYSILTVINMFYGLLSFILHLFIIIYNLLFVYSLLFIFLLVYIVYYFCLFLGGVIWK
jgi:hypothetical protein